MWSIILGLVIMLISIASGTGLQKEIQRKVVLLQGDAVISKFNQNSSYEPAPFTFDDSIRSDLLDLQEITHIQAFSTKAGILKTQDDFEGVVLKGVDEEHDWQVLEDFLEEGAFPKINPDKRTDQLLVSRYFAGRLSLEVGQKVILYFLQPPPKKPRRIPFQICGIYHSGMEHFDQIYVYGDLKQIRRINGWSANEVGGVEVFLDPEEDISLLNGEINGRIPYDLISRTDRQINPQLHEWLDLFDLNIVVILLIMIAVAAVNMITVLLILILDRKQMIGIMMALGSRDSGVRRIFLIQGGILLGRALFWGNLIGIGLLLIQKYTGLFRLDEASYYVSAAPVHLDPVHFILLNIGTALVCILMLLLPSMAISGIRPARTIKKI
jgi:lipoprotein-releasing system permease protein